MVNAGEIGLIEQVVDSVLAEHPRLRRTSGKKVFELRPDMNWEKGKAALWLLRALDLDRPDTVPFYLGDDVTDRDAFRAIRGKGISILVAEQPQPTRADYRLANPSDVQAFLQKLAVLLREREA
jgi:alpha,alpha-trehalase